MRWRPVTTFFQSLIDMKNAQIPGAYRAWAHDYRPDLARFISEVYGLPASPEQLARIEEALEQRETVRERLFAGRPDRRQPSDGARPAAVSRRHAGGLEQHLGSRQVAKVVYGSIIGLALVVALEAHPPAPGVMAVWLRRHGRRGRPRRGLQRGRGRRDPHRQPVTRRRAGATWSRTPSRSAFGVAFPAVFFVALGHGPVRDRHGVHDRQVDRPGADRLLRVLGGPVRGASPHRALLKGALVALIGAGLILLKSLVH